MGLQAHGLLSGQLHAVDARLALPALSPLPISVCSVAFCPPVRLCTWCTDSAVKARYWHQVPSPLLHMVSSAAGAAT